MPGAHVSAQRYPVKPVRIITSEVGSGTDFASRLIAQGLSEKWNQRAIVENRPSGSIPGEVVSTSAPDGYTLLLGGSAFWLGPLMRSTPYDPITQFAPITMAVYSPTVLVVHPSLPAKSVKDLIAIAKGKPGALTYASAGPGSITQLLGEWIKLKSGTNILDVPYKSVGAEMPDLLGGQITTGYLVATVIMAHVKSGKLRGLAVSGRNRLPLLRDVPTMTEGGLPGVEASAWSGYFVPAGVPQPMIHRLNAELVRVFKSPDIRDVATATGTEVVGGRPDEFAAFIRAEITKWGGIIKEAGIKPQ